ncbi:MAG: PVC-type heme-binding CxxCH protein, partial [Pirellulales bacterium]
MNELLFRCSTLLLFIAVVFGNLIFARKSSASEDRSQQPDWTVVQVPQSWKNAPKGHVGASEDYSWYRCVVLVPKSWQDQELTLFVEAVDDAREVYFNGQRIGGLGTFPPEYRSGLGISLRFPIATTNVSFGEINVISIRIHRNESRTGFNVAAPVLFGEHEAIRLQGPWEAAIGDNKEWANLSQRTAFGSPPFAKLEHRHEVEEVLRKLEGDDGPLSIDDSLAKIDVPIDLVAEFAVGEPHVRQPLSIKWDARGRLWVMQYLQYPEPAGLTMVSRDKFLRAVYDKIPAPPPLHFHGKDKITIHEDTDGDGRADVHKTFIEGLSLATSFAIGRGGVYVLNPPYLLFYADHDQDDQPDGDPEILLEGFGLEDSHSIANSLRWGPDGWLYACQGSTVSGIIRRYGSADPPTRSMGQLVWRYHPESRSYEIFAEGGGNAFGLEIDSKGRIYSGHNGGDTRGFHYVQGGYFQKGFGKHGQLSNAFAFGYFLPIAHHRVERFTHEFVIYEGNTLPKHYHGQLFGVGPLQGHVVQSEIMADGSSVKTNDLGHLLTSDDSWCRPVDIKVGPDGAIYVVDMYEQRIDHASHYQGRIHRESGRIWRLRSKSMKYAGPFNLEVLPSLELIDVLHHGNKWFRQQALRLFADRKDAQIVPLLRQTIREQGGQFALEALWALNLSGGLDEQTAIDLLDHDDPFVRLWTVRLMCDDGHVSIKAAKRLAALAAVDKHVQVRSQLACSARRLEADASLPIVRNLLARSDDSNDIHLPLLLWWAIEAKCDSNRDAVIALFADKTLWDQPMVQRHLIERLMRRFALAGRRVDLLTCAKLLRLATNQKAQKQLLAGFEEAFQGRSLRALPEELITAMTAVGGGSLALRVRQGDATAIQDAMNAIADHKTDTELAISLIGILGDVREPTALSMMLDLISTTDNESVRSAALNALQVFEDEQIANRVLSLLDRFTTDVTKVALSCLASRRSWSLKLLDAIDAGQIDVKLISLDVVRKVLLHQDDRIAERVHKHWGTVTGATSAEMLTEISRVTSVINSGSGIPHKGKPVFNNLCGKCHQLFSEGGRVGPDLTPLNRNDLHRALVNVINPSIEIREGYESYLCLTDDGRTLSGFIVDQDDQVVVLRSAEGQRLITLLGAGGTGKTRLSQRFGGKMLAQFPGGVWFADLTEARSLSGIISAMSTALDLPLTQKDPLAQLANTIMGRG